MTVLTPLAARFAADQAAENRRIAERLHRERWTIDELKTEWQIAAASFLRAAFGCAGTDVMQQRAQKLFWLRDEIERSTRKP